MDSKFRILITTGDADGIGWEVTAKALNSLGPKAGVQFLYFRHLPAAGLKPALNKKFKHTVVSNLEQARALPFDSKTAVEIRSPRNPAAWVEESAKACLAGHFHALVTAPLSKTTITQAGFKDIGHTEILARVCGTQDLFMGFMGKKFSVVLMTGHHALKEALTELSSHKLKASLLAANQLRKLLPAKKRERPIALVGVNPHAGEQGLIGSEEGWMLGLLEDYAKLVGEIAGPLVPDAAFLPQNWDSFSVYLCPYHDQGLIPFKMVHGFKGGVHLTLGLPFVRTSVDHGTAKELFGKNKAESGSMKDALQTAIRLVKEK
jgi:4-hydroxythreonine-4-phosphate dehydrogenase